MTKSEICQLIADRTGLSKEQTVLAVEGFMKEVMKATEKGDSVFLRGFGTFYRKHQKEKIARHIKQNTPLMIAARDVPGFKPAGKFKKSVIAPHQNEHRTI